MLNTCSNSQTLKLIDVSPSLRKKKKFLPVSLKKYFGSQKKGKSSALFSQMLDKLYIPKLKNFKFYIVFNFFYFYMYRVITLYVLCIYYLYSNVTIKITVIFNRFLKHLTEEKTLKGL